MKRDERLNVLIIYYNYNNNKVIDPKLVETNNFFRKWHSSSNSTIGIN